jgi:hypothetical protein
LKLLTKQLISFNVTIENEDFVMQSINNLPKEYDLLVEAVEKYMNQELEDQITI